MFKVGDRVRFTNRMLHWDEPEFYPKCGTVGEVVLLFDSAEPSLLVQWEDGSTSDGDCWCCDPRDVEVVA